MIFAAWNSEERGLLGAWAYTEDPIVPLDRIVAVLNMDMIGRNEEVPVGGGGALPRSRACRPRESNANATNIIGTRPQPGSPRRRSSKANQGIGLDLKFRYDNNVSNLMRRSDHWPFIQRGVPGRLGAHRAASRLPHHLRPTGEDQLSEDGEDRAPGVSGELGSRQRRHPAAVAAGERWGGDEPALIPCKHAPMRGSDS